MLCDVGSAELLMPSPRFQSDAARVKTAAELLALAQTYGVSREAMLRRFAETHSAAVAAVFFSWKLKPTQQRTIGLQEQGHLFGDGAELARQAKKLRIDYSIPSEQFAGDGCFIPNDKSVPSEGPIFEAASNGMPSGDVCRLDFGNARMVKMRSRPSLSLSNSKRDSAQRSRRVGGSIEPILRRSPSARTATGRRTIAVSDPGTLRGLTQFATQFGFTGSATSL
jgi:hypothetical protein